MAKLELRKATRKRAKLKLGVTGPSGSGKTYSSLLLAYGLVGDWNKVALIDSENGSGELYSSLGEYNVVPMEAPYSPERYIEAIDACIVGGMEAVVIDSVSHEWDGTGGCLEIYESLGGRFQDWAKVTPRHRKFLQKILQSPVHVITTARKKQDYSMDKNSDGKAQVTKVGMKEVQREGFEYELTINFDLSMRHLATCSKDRTGIFKDRPEFIIDEKTGQELLKWSESGSEDPRLIKSEIMAQVERLAPSVHEVGGIEVVGFIKRVTKLDPTDNDIENLKTIRNTLKGIEHVDPDTGEEIPPEVMNGGEPTKPTEPPEDPETPQGEEEVVPEEESIEDEQVEPLEDTTAPPEEESVEDSAPEEVEVSQTPSQLVTWKDPWEQASEEDVASLKTMLSAVDGIMEDIKEEEFVEHLTKEYDYKFKSLKGLTKPRLKAILEKVEHRASSED